MFDDCGPATPRYNPEFVARVMAKREAERNADLAKRAKEAAIRAKAEQKLEIERRASAAEMLEIRERSKRTQAMLDARYADDGATTLTADEIIATVGQRHGFTVAEIKGASRRIPLVACRHEAVWEVHRLKPHLTTPQLGRIFGGRDHTTVVYVLQKMRARQAA